VVTLEKKKKRNVYPLKRNMDCGGRSEMKQGGKQIFCSQKGEPKGKRVLLRKRGGKGKPDFGKKKRDTSPSSVKRIRSWRKKKGGGNKDREKGNSTSVRQKRGMDSEFLKKKKKKNQIRAFWARVRLGERKASRE